MLALSGIGILMVCGVIKPVLGDPFLRGLRKRRQKERALVRMMFSDKVRQNGFYPILASHDDSLLKFALSEARANKWVQGSYEFEVLYG